MFGRAALGAAMMIVTGCQPVLAVQAPGKRTPRGCTFGERKKAACDAIRAATLVDEQGSHVAARVVHCEVRELLGEVTWNVVDEAPLRTVVRLGSDGPRDALRPVSVEPIVLQWPHPEPVRPVRRMRVTVAHSCVAGVTADRTIDVRIPAVDSGACVAEARLTGGDHKWCTRPTSGDATFVIREHDPFSHGIRHSALLELDPLQARLELDGTTYVTRETETVSDLVEQTWQLPSEVDESCRDGALKVVEARRGAQWKAILRYCRPAISIARLTELFRSG